MKKQNIIRRARGSIIVYILVAIFLLTLLIAALTTGAKKSATSEQMDELMLFLQEDIATIQQGINECVQTFSKPTDVNSDGTICSKSSDAGCAALPIDNPNPPFPLYGTGTDILDPIHLPSGAAGVEGGADAGTDVTNIRCAGANDGQRTVFAGSLGNKFRTLSDTATYTTKYFSNTTEGAYLRITRTSAEGLWTEAISRLNGKYSKCAAAAVTAPGTCVNGCFYYWIVRKATSTIATTGGEAGCP